MTPARLAQMNAAITTLQAQGEEVTAAAVHRRVRGHRRTVQVYVKAWKEQQREASPVVPCPVAPTPPPPPPVPHLLALHRRVAQRAQVLEAKRRDLAQLEQEQAQDIADLRNGRLNASRLTPRVRQEVWQETNPTALMQQEDAARQRDQDRAELTALVGEAEVKQVLADSQYQPWWLEG
jgi:hypothetical protein